MNFLHLERCWSPPLFPLEGSQNRSQNTGQILEKRWQSREEEIDYKDYYERHSLQRKKEPKRKEGSQSRIKNYPNLKS